jgi:hypothetical protein
MRVATMYYDGRWEQGFFGKHSKPSRQHKTTRLIWLALLLGPLFWTVISVTIAIHVHNMIVHLSYLVE